MEKLISDFAYVGNHRGIRWLHDGQKYQLDFKNDGVAVLMKSGDHLLVVDIASEDGPHNAYILKPDGSIQTRIRNPEAGNGAVCFCDVFYIEEELSLIIAFGSFQMRCIIDEFGNTMAVKSYR